ncbi:MAG: serine/threonine protein kinase [Bacteroidetes bacterium]|nr:serine/threonine protein kinase [Bacteroidota bacterium]
MAVYDENSGFENNQVNVLDPSNSSVVERLPFQSETSEVFKIRINDRWLLLKRIAPEYRDNPLFIAALEKEFNLGFHLDHPNIVRYLNRGVDEEGLFLIAEFVDGYTLRQLIRNNPDGIRNIKLIVRIVQQLSDALNYLHNQQIFHLDLKPENIIITNKGNNVKIIDFGLACSDSYMPISSGTKRYAAPEQFSHPERADARSDIYSLGLIILEALTGRTEISELRKVPVRFRKFVEKCTAQDPVDRFQSAEVVSQAFSKKSWRWSYLMSGFVAILLFFIFRFYYNPTPNQGIGIEEVKTVHFTGRRSLVNPTTDVVSHPMLNSTMMLESKKQLDTIEKRTKQFLSPKTTDSDSLYVCHLGQELFFNFLQKVKEYDKNPGSRSRKLVLVDLKNECVEAYSDSLNKYVARYGIGSATYQRLTDLFRIHADASESKIDAIVFNRGN